MNPETADMDEDVINKSPTWFMLLKTWIWMATILSPFAVTWFLWISAETVENRSFRMNGGRYSLEHAKADRERQELTDAQQTSMILENRQRQVSEFNDFRQTQTKMLEVTNRIDERVQSLMRRQDFK